MKEKFDTIRNLLSKYSVYGRKETNNGGILIGHPSYLKEDWWIVELFHNLSDNDIDVIENRCATRLPASYKYFLRNITNGLVFQFGTFYLYGYVSEYNRDINCRQPFDIFTPNVEERGLMLNIKHNMFIIGGYSSNGAKIYIDTDTNNVYLCSEDDITPIYSWSCFEDMLVSELTRLYTFYTEDGRRIDKTKSILPI